MSVPGAELKLSPIYLVSLQEIWYRHSRSCYQPLWDERATETHCVLAILMLAISNLSSVKKQYPFILH